MQPATLTDLHNRLEILCLTLADALRKGAACEAAGDRLGSELYAGIAGVLRRQLEHLSAEIKARAK